MQCLDDHLWATVGSWLDARSLGRLERAAPLFSLPRIPFAAAKDDAGSALAPTAVAPVVTAAAAAAAAGARPGGDSASSPPATSPPCFSSCPSSQRQRHRPSWLAVVRPPSVSGKRKRRRRGSCGFSASSEGAHSIVEEAARLAVQLRFPPV
jgi:hypothetical protein